MTFSSLMVRMYAGAFAGDNLETVVGNLPERYGLDDAYLPDAYGKLMQRLLVEFPSWLVGVCLYLVNGYLVDSRAALGAHVLGRDEGVESPAECVVFLVYCHLFVLVNDFFCKHQVVLAACGVCVV